MFFSTKNLNPGLFLVEAESLPGLFQKQDLWLLVIIFWPWLWIRHSYCVIYFFGFYRYWCYHFCYHLTLSFFFFFSWNHETLSFFLLSFTPFFSFPSPKFWEGLDYAMRRKIQFLKSVYRSFSIDQSYRIPYLAGPKLVFLLQIRDPFFLNSNSGLGCGYVILIVFIYFFRFYRYWCYHLTLSFFFFFLKSWNTLIFCYFHPRFLFPESKFWEGLDYAMRRKIQF